LGFSKKREARKSHVLVVSGSLIFDLFLASKAVFVCGRLIRFLIKPMEKPQQKIMSKTNLNNACCCYKFYSTNLTQACFVINRQFFDLKKLSTNEWLPYLI
jgi:hypothetical protein